MKGSDHLINTIIPKLNTKQIQSIFRVTQAGLLDNLKIVYTTAFYLKIKPVVDRYKWAIDWDMGSVSFEDNKGRAIDSPAIDKIPSRLSDLFDKDFPVTQNGILWDIMTGLGCYNRYHINTGLVLITSI
jgi:hypothetical protein